MKSDPRVDDYIAGLPEWQRALRREGAEINAAAMQVCFAQICADDRAGDWRKLKAQ